VSTIAVDPGIDPVVPEQRLLSGVDNLVLWGSLSVGLLVLVSGSYLVPALGLGQALVAIAIGSALGGAVLGCVAWLGAELHVPGMVLLRAPLGLRGSLVPTVLNVAQGFGWTVFEVIVVAHVARAAAGGPLALWTVAATLVVSLLAIGGPLVVVRRVLRAVGVPVTVAVGLYLTVWSLDRVDWAAARHGHGGLGFWLAVDLVVAIPISWAPLVADYARFASDRRAALAGTFLASTVANAWFYALGALLVLAGAADPSYGLGPAAGAVALGLLAVAETDKPFADLYSTVVSIQNARPSWSAPALAAAGGLLVCAAALVLPFTGYESFLYLLGATFVPLAGVLLAHAVRRRPYPVADLYRARGVFGRWNWRSFAAWLAGFGLYEWIAPTQIAGWHRLLAGLVDALGTGFAPAGVARFGASIPSFALAFALTLALTTPRGERSP
jgi:nucleobase:cation symporter-1, NCS1 family